MLSASHDFPHSDLALESNLRVAVPWGLLHVQYAICVVHQPSASSDVLVEVLHRTKYAVLEIEKALIPRLAFRQTSSNMILGVSMRILESPRRQMRLRAIRRISKGSSQEFLLSHKR